jgi:hypothetical protein
MGDEEIGQQGPVILYTRATHLSTRVPRDQNRPAGRGGDDYRRRRSADKRCSHHELALFTHGGLDKTSSAPSFSK